MRALHRCLIALVLGSGAASPASSQIAYSLEGGLATLTGVDGGSTFQAGLRVASLKPRAAGFDISLVTIPEALVSGAFILMPDVDVSYNAPLGDGVHLVPRAGLSVLALSESGDGAAAYGLNVGAALVASLHGPAAIRIDYGYRHYFGEGGNAGISSVAFGIALVH